MENDDLDILGDQFGEDDFRESAEDITLGSRDISLMNENLKAIKDPQHKLIEWFASIPNFECDLVSTLSGSWLFFVNGESLLLHCLAALQISEETLLEEGIESLLVCYQFERFLRLLQNAGGKFKLVFFDVLKHGFEDCLGGFSWTLREAVVLHCELTGVRYLLFNSWYDEDYSACVRRWKPACMLLEDGSSFLELCDIRAKEASAEKEEVRSRRGYGLLFNLATLEGRISNLKRKSAGLDNPDDSTETSILGVLQTQLLYLISNCLTRHFYTALCHRMNMKGNRFYVYSMSTDYAVKLLESDGESFIKGLKMQPTDTQTEDKQLRAQSEHLELLIASSTDKDNEKSLFLDIGDLLIFHYCKSTALSLELEDVEEVQMADYCLSIGKFFFLANFYKNRLSLAERCHRSLDPSQWDFGMVPLTAAIGIFFAAAGPILKMLVNRCRLSISSRKQVEGLFGQRAAADFVDTRLLNTVILSSMCSAPLYDWKLGSSYFGLDENDVDRLETLWKEIIPPSLHTPTCSVGGGFFPIIMSSFANMLPQEEVIDSWNAFAKQEDSAVTAATLNMGLLKKLEHQLYAPASGLIPPYKNCKLEDQFHLKPPADADAPLELKSLMLPSLLPREADVANIETNLYQQDRMYSSIVFSNGDSVDKEAQKARVKRLYQKEVLWRMKYSASLGKSSKMHHPVFVKQNHVWRETKQLADVPKLSNSASRMLGEIQEEKQKKLLKVDQEILTNLRKQEMPIITADSTNFVNTLLDMTVGFSRIVDQFAGFSAVMNILKAPQTRAEYILDIIEAASERIMFLGPWRYKSSEDEELLHCVVMMFRLVHDFYIEFEEYILPEGVKKLQKVLLSLGFKRSSRNLFDSWKHLRTQRMMEAAVQEKEQKAKAKKSNFKGKQQAAANAQEADAAAVQKHQNSSSKRREDAEYNRLFEGLEEFFVASPREYCELRVPEGYEYEIQMIHMSKYMTRNTGSKSDPRVLFKPDAWQVTLLDIVDRWESAIVRSPTSSGKTFVCYFVMDRVLQYDNESIVVYVCPSKALMLQVQAEVDARFTNKVYPVLCATELTAIADRYRRGMKYLNCQILITVPYVLESLLMSAEHNDWVKKIKYVILDEIHSLSMEGESYFWEHLIELITAPIIAMSATLGNAIPLQNWLKRCSARDIVVNYVQYRHRYSDLFKHVIQDGEIVPMNSFAALNYEQLLEQGFSEEFTLNAVDAVALYKALIKVLGADGFEWLSPDSYFAYCAHINRLQSSIYVKTLLSELLRHVVHTKRITPKIFYQLQIELVKRTDPVYPPTIPIKDAGDFGSTLSNGSADFDVSTSADINGVDSKPSEDAETEELNDEAYDKPLYVKSSPREYHDANKLYDILTKLRKKDFLPVIAFNLSIDSIMHCLSVLTRKLQDDQHNKYYGTEAARAATRAKNKKRENEYKLAVKAQLEREKQKALSKEQKEQSGISTNEQEDVVIIEKPIDVALEYDEEFNFVNWKVYVTRQEEFEEHIRRLRYVNFSVGVKRLLIEALRRGIGVHYAALPKRYRDVVEICFRMGLLRVIFATSTLSLGIHMPCRTVILMGDFMQLNPLLFHQMSGRAGRRGFDIAGNVIMWSIPESKIFRLITSPLSILQGEFPISPTFALRVIYLANALFVKMKEASDNKDLKSKAFYMTRLKQIFNLFYNPLVTVPGENIVLAEDKLLNMQRIFEHYFRFSLNRLISLDNIDSNGNLSFLGLANLQLFTEAPFTIMLINLLRCDELEQFLLNTQESNRPLALLSVLCHFIACKHSTLSLLLKSSLAKLSTSRNALRKFSYGFCRSPLLYALPKSLSEPVGNFFESEKKNWFDCIRSFFSTREFSAQEFCLPYSGVSFHSLPTTQSGGKVIPPLLEGIDAMQDSPVSEDQTFLQHFKSLIVNSKVRSPFMGLSGRSDNEFSSLKEALYACRETDCPGFDFLPDIEAFSYSFERLTDSSADNVILMNSYALDFFMNGKLSSVVTMNGIERSEVFETLFTFSFAVSKLQQALSFLGKGQCGEIVLTSLSKIIEHYDSVIAKESA